MQCNFCAAEWYGGGHLCQAGQDARDAEIARLRGRVAELEAERTVFLSAFPTTESTGGEAAAPFEVAPAPKPKRPRKKE